MPSPLRHFLLNLATALSLIALPFIAIDRFLDHPRLAVPLNSHFTLLPHPIVAIVALLLPTVRLIHFFRDSAREARFYYRLAHHICLDCGYDCRHTPDRCPECGATPPDLTKESPVRAFQNRR